MPQCGQNTFKNDLKMARNGQFRAAYRGREPAKVSISNGSLAASGQYLTTLVYHWRKGWGETGLLFPVLTVFQPSLFFAWNTCNDADMFCKNLHFVVCLKTLQYRLMFVLFFKKHIQQLPRAVTLLVTPKSSLFLLNSSMNSKGFALFILQPVKFGNKVVLQIYWSHLSVCSFSAAWHHNKQTSLLYNLNLKFDSIFFSLAGTAMALTLKVEAHSGQESPYLGILHLFHDARCNTNLCQFPRYNTWHQ